MLTSGQREEMQLAYDRFEKRYSELAKKRIEVAQPLIERRSAVKPIALARSEYQSEAVRISRMQTGR